MKNLLMKAVRGLAVGAILCAAPVVLADHTKGESTATEKGSGSDKAADNTGRNKPERKAGEPTAEQQNNNRSDLDITAKIRRSLVTDKSLSVYAHNVKIITQNGSVTLKGPVRSEEEKQTVEKKAAEVAGKTKVKCELEVAPSK